MTEHKHNNKTTLIVVLIAAVAVGLLAYYKTARLHMVNRSEYKKMFEALEEKGETKGSSSDQLSSLEKWAEKNKLSWNTDSKGNLIIQRAATSSKSDQPATVIVTEYNRNTLADDASSLATAKYIAEHGKGTPLTVIFLNNEDNLHKGAAGLSGSLIPDNSNVFFLDSNKSSYLSMNSFAGKMSDFAVKKEMTARTCDSGVKITISGCTTNDPRSSMGSQPDPIDTFENLLTYLKGKSVPFQISDLKVVSHGNMYPESLTATVMVNSYTMPDLTKYLDNKGESFRKKYHKDYPDIAYTYETIEKEEQLPSQVYSDETTGSMINLLYTIENGVYRFDKTEATDVHKENDPYAYNCFTDLKENGDTIDLTVSTSALNKIYMDQVEDENSTAAKLANASVSTVSETDAFTGINPQLPLQFSNFYTKVNNVTGKDMGLQEKDDTYVTACSYLSAANDRASILHVSVAQNGKSYIANALMNFIAQSVKVK